SMTLTRLRHGAGEVVVADEARAWATASSDAGDLLDALRDGEWERAAELYRGAFLDGVAFDDGSVELEEWALVTREYLASRVQHGLLELAEHAARRQDFGDVAELAERALLLPGAGAPDPATLRRLYTLLTASRSVRAPLVRAELADLGDEISLTTAEARELAARPVLESGLAIDHRVTAVPASPASGAVRGVAFTVAGKGRAVPTNVPARRTSFAGRERDLRAVEKALATPACRWVTVSGPGCVG